MSNLPALLRKAHSALYLKEVPNCQCVRCRTANRIEEMEAEIEQLEAENARLRKGISLAADDLRSVAGCSHPDALQDGATEVSADLTRLLKKADR